MASPNDADPYDAYAELAERPGLLRLPAQGWWLAAHPDAVRAVLANEACAVRPAAEPVPSSLKGTAAAEVFARLVRMRDDAARIPVKAAIVRALAALSEAEVDGSARAAAERLVADGPAGRAVSDLAPHVLARLLGVPEEEHHAVARCAARFARALAPDAIANDSGAARDLERWVRSGDGRLARALREAALDPEDVVANTIGLFFQAFDATAGLIGNALVGIARDPTFRPDASERRIRAAVERAAVRDPSIHNTRRFVTREVTVVGETLHAGDIVLVLLAAAARGGGPDDEALAFGHGRHACPARALAITIACAGVSALLGHGPWPAAPRYRPSANARIPELEQVGESRTDREA